MKTFKTAELDEINSSILKESLFSRARFKEPKIGDFLQLEDGSLKRICANHKYVGEVQVERYGSYNITTDGSCDFSGGCDFDLIKTMKYKFMGQVEKAAVCFFNHGEVKANNLIRVTDVPFKVWVLK